MHRASLTTTVGVSELSLISLRMLTLWMTEHNPTDTNCLKMEKSGHGL